MPNENPEVEVFKTKDSVKEQVLASESEKSMTVLMQKVMGGEGSFEPNEEQVDEILAQKSKIIDYVHQDKLRDSKDRRFYFLGILIALVTVVLLVLFFAKEYLTQIVSLIVGAFGGYGVGKSQQSKD